MRVAVAGGTGAAGAPLVARLRAAGHDVIVLARATGVDLTSPDGPGHRLDGVEVVVDATNRPALSARASEGFFGAVTRALVAAGARAGVAHHLVLSVVGTDGAPTGYYRGKREQERLVRGSSGGWTVLRATQLHDFAGQVADQGRVGPVTLVPRMRSAPVATVEVVDALIELVRDGPRREVLELSGPRVEQVDDMVRRLLRHQGSRRPVLGVAVPGAAGRALRNGVLVASDPWRTGRQTFDDWLAGQPGSGPGVENPDPAPLTR